MLDPEQVRRAERYEGEFFRKVAERDAGGTHWPQVYEIAGEMGLDSERDRNSIQATVWALIDKGLLQGDTGRSEMGYLTVSLTDAGQARLRREGMHR